MQPGEKFVRCLLDQKDEESRRARRLRRRTLLISILIQAIVLTLLLLRPLFGAEELKLAARLIPLPPYRGGPLRHRSDNHRAAPARAHPGDVVLRPVFFPAPQSRPANAEPESAPDLGRFVPGMLGYGSGDPNGLIPLPPGLDAGRQIPVPPPPATPPPPGRIRRPSEVQEAMLIERIEPRYPALARQAHLQGAVELHAIIARDGSMQSVEIVSGNLILANAARDAVVRWRYRPTLLNGQPVEVETFIHVIFKMP